MTTIDAGHRSRKVAALSPDVQQRLQCPKTKARLIECEGLLQSSTDPCVRYPIIDGVPILICDEKSLFSVDDFVGRKSTTFDLSGRKRGVAMLMKLLPSISANVKARTNYARLAQSLPRGARILVIGGSIMGQGMEPIYEDGSFEVVGSDVSFGPYTGLICDAHDVPFADETFDCVIVQAVLEHVLDPVRCVAEIWRVLKPTGVVYSETPFMQQVHMRQYDFTRFTHLGHRRLFRRFEEVGSGPACGPGMALAWAYTFFLRSFATSPLLRRLLTLFGYLTSFPLKYFDYFLIDRPGAYDAASGFYFWGRKSSTSVDDRELIKQFRGV